MGKKHEGEQKDDERPIRTSANIERITSTASVLSELGGERVAETQRGGVWIRSDGAVCVDNECVTLETTADGSLGLTFDPNKCSYDVADNLTSQLLRSVSSGKGVRLTMKPRQFEEE